MELIKLDADFTVCQIKDAGNVDFSREFVFLSKTDEEISLVCESDYLPSNVISSEAGWKMLKIAGTLDFEMIGVIARISGLLAEAGVSIFVISTYNTDYILLKAANFNKGVSLLANNGYTIY